MVKKMQPNWKKWVKLAQKISFEAKNKSDPNQAWCDFFEDKFGKIWEESWNQRSKKETDWPSDTKEDFTNHLLDFHFAFNNGSPKEMFDFFRKAESEPKFWQNNRPNNYPKSSIKSLAYAMQQMELYQTLSYNPENVLEFDDNHRTLSFLFLFYHPFNINCNMLFHHHEKAPLITFPQISKNHFDMLLYLTETETPTEWKLLQKDFNLNHQLIARFIDNLQPQTGFFLKGKDNINWIKLGMPAEKIKILLKAGFSLNNFEQLRTDRTFLTFESMSHTVNWLIAETIEEKMQEVALKETKGKMFLQKINKI